MTFRSSLLFARSLIFPRNALNSTARKSVIGAILCVALSLIPLIIVLSVSEGMIGGMTERIIGLSSGHLQTYIRRTSPDISNLENFMSFADEIKNVSGVLEAYPQIECDGLACGKTYRTGARVRALPSDIFSTNEDFARLFNTVSGNTEVLSKNPKNAVIGEKLAELLSLKAGDSFRIITTKSSANGKIIPNAGVFKVCAIVSSGYQELDALWCFIPVETGFKFIPNQSATYSVIIKTKDAFSPALEDVRIECNKVALGTGVTFDWKQLNESQFENFSSTKVLLLFVMTLIVVVAAVNISSALVMLVMERRREIAILKSIGGSNAGITCSFLLAGEFCALAGSFIGFPLGLLLAVNANHLIHLIEVLVNFFAKVFFVLGGGNLKSFASIKLLDPEYYLSEISITIPWKELFVIWILVLVLALIASFVPSYKAGKENPLENFRKS